MFSNAAILLLIPFFKYVYCDYQSYCYMEDASPYQYFGTKTSYALSRAQNMEILQPDVCKPIYIWALIRHGTRYSSKVELKWSNELQRQILANHETEKRGTLCFKDLKNLRQWTSQGNGKTTDDLAPQGVAELSELAMRLAQKFENLLLNSSDNIHFQTTLKRRTKESAAAFAGGMFGRDRAANINISSYEDVLHFLELSEKYQRKVSQNNETFKEEELFLKTKYMRNLIKEVSDRLGFNESLPEKSIKQMYFSCAFENAWTPNSDPAFCAAFTKEHLQILEYFYFDLHDYYEAGYGSLYNIKIHSPVVEDLLSKMTEAAKSESRQYEAPKAHFYFSHSAVLTHTITKLGLYRDDEPLLHNNYGRRNAWSMHTISPFSGNLIAVMYKCDEKSWLEKYEIALYHNEQIVQIPGCATALCPFSRFSDLVHSNNNASDSEEGTSNARGFSTTVVERLFYFLSVLSLPIFNSMHHRHFV